MSPSLFTFTLLQYCVCIVGCEFHVCEAEPELTYRLWFYYTMSIINISGAVFVCRPYQKKTKKTKPDQTTL